MRIASSGWTGAVILIAACGGGALPITGTGGGSHDLGDPNLHLSPLGGFGADTSIVAPDTVRVGEHFTASFSTGYGGCDPTDTMVEAQTGDVVRFTPYNRRFSTPGAACPTFVGFVTRSGDVVFSTPGVATIRAIGYRGPVYAPYVDSISKTVQVLPVGP